MIKLNRWIPTKKNAAFKRINFWIYIKISTTTFVTAKISLVKVDSIQQNIFSCFTLISLCIRRIMNLLRRSKIG